MVRQRLLEVIGGNLLRSKEVKMSWFSKLFQKGPKNPKFAPTLNGWMPVYSQFGTDIYASDVVQQALKCIVDEM